MRVLTLFRMRDGRRGGGGGGKSPPPPPRYKFFPRNFDKRKTKPTEFFDF